MDSTENGVWLPWSLTGAWTLQHVFEDVDWDVFEDEDLHVSVNIVFDVWDVDTNNKCFGHNAIRNIIARFLPSQFFVSLNDPILTSHLNLKNKFNTERICRGKKKLNHY